MSFEINFFEKFIADFINEITFKKISERLKKEDLMADVDDQYSHHFHYHKSS